MSRFCVVGDTEITPVFPFRGYFPIECDPTGTLVRWAVAVTDHGGLLRTTAKRLYLPFVRLLLFALFFDHAHIAPENAIRLHCP